MPIWLIVVIAIVIGIVLGVLGFLAYFYWTFRNMM